MAPSSGAKSDLAVNTMKAQELRDPTRHRPPPPDFHCSESVEEGSVGFVTFHCSPPPSSELTGNLKYNCRKRSMGVLVEEEARVDDKDLELAYETVDPNFFDAGYTLAGATGFQIWAGTRLLLETLTWPPRNSDAIPVVEHPLLTFWREQITRTCQQGNHGRPLRVLELGAGIGVLGTNLAAAGAHVLLTDLATLVENATYPNILANCNKLDDNHVNNKHICDHTTTSMNDEYAECLQWLQPFHGVPIGKGWAATTPLDWTQPISKQLHRHHYENVDLIVASDCVWLVSMLNALLDTVAFFFQQSSTSQPPNMTIEFSTTRYSRRRYKSYLYHNQSSHSIRACQRMEDGMSGMATSVFGFCKERTRTTRPTHNTWIQQSTNSINRRRKGSICLLDLFRLTWCIENKQKQPKAIVPETHHVQIQNENQDEGLARTFNLFACFVYCYNMINLMPLFESQ